MPTSALVTGGAGFIGSSLARALVTRGDRVRVVDDLSSGKKSNLADLEGHIDFVEGSLLDDGVLERAFEGIELVFHQAAVPSVPRSMAAPLVSHQANATGTLRVLDAARRHGVRRVVYAGSSSAYGETLVSPKVETMPSAPLSPYAVSKVAGENYCSVYARHFGVETVTLRYFNVFGPRQDPTSQYAAVIPRFVIAGLEDKRPTIYGDGTQSRDFCFIENVIEANLKASVADAAKVSGQVFNVACGAATTLNQVLGLIGEELGHRVEATYEPVRNGDIKHSLADIGKARAAFGYSGAISFPEGLRRTIEWYRDNRR